MNAPTHPDPTAKRRLPMQNPTPLPVLGLEQILAMLRARLALIAWVTAGTVLAALVITLLIPKSYTTTAEIYIDFGAADPTVGRYSAQIMDESYLQTQTDIIRSERILAEVIEATGLMRTPAGRELVKQHGAPGAKQVLVERLAKSLDVVLKKPGRIVMITLKGDDPDVVKTALDTVVKSYLAATQQITRGPAEERQKQYAEQLDVLRMQMEKVQKQLSDYQIEHNIIGPNNGQGDVESRLAQEMAQKLTDTRVARKAAQAKLKSVKDELASGQNTGVLAALPETRVLQDLRGRIETLDAQLAASGAALGPKHPKLIGLVTEKAAAVQALKLESQAVVVNMENQLAELSRLEADIEQELNRKNAGLVKREQHLAVIRGLQTELESTRAVYDVSLQKYDQFLLTNGAQSSSFEVLRWPQKPLRASSPVLSRNLVFSLPMGLFFGLALAFLFEMSNRRFLCQADVETYMHLPVLGRAP